MRRLLVIALIVGWHTTAQAGPLPPCGVSPIPTLGVLDGPPQWRIWSADELRGEPLALSILALDGGLGSPVASLKVGETHRFMERDDNGGGIVYGLRVLQRDPAHLTVAIENVTPIRIAFITAFPPGALQTVTFVDRAGDDQWNTFQITRVGANASSFVLSCRGSLLNRPEAVRRYLSGQATDHEPPLAPH